MYWVWVLKSTNNTYYFVFDFLLGNPQTTGLMETWLLFIFTIFLLYYFYCFIVFKWFIYFISFIFFMCLFWVFGFNQSQKSTTLKCMERSSSWIFFTSNCEIWILEYWETFLQVNFYSLVEWRNSWWLTFPQLS